MEILALQSNAKFFKLPNKIFAHSLSMKILHDSIIL